jgi:hypothetical protein
VYARRILEVKSGNINHSVHEYDNKIQIIRRDGKKEVGEISMIPRDDGHLEVSNVLVWPGHQRAGDATGLYKQAFYQAESRGKELHTSNDRTPDAIKLHSHFEKQGILQGTRIIF